MKKYLLVNLTILFAAAFLWAADATTMEPSVDIEAEATVSWGIDFTKKGKPIKHGFNNEASWAVKFPLIKKQSMTSTKADVPVFGEVVLEDVALNITSKNDIQDGKFALDGKVKGMAAKFVFYGAYITAYDKPDFESNYANLWEPLKKNGKFNAKGDTYRFKPGFSGYGLKLGYANDDLMGLDVGLKFGSSGNWDSKVDAGTTDYQIKYFDGNTKLGKDDYILMGDPAGNSRWVNGEDPIWDGKPYPEGSFPFFKNETEGSDYYNQYGMGLDFAMQPLGKMLGLGFTANFTFDKAKKYGDVNGAADDNLALGLGAEVTSAPVDGLKLKLGFDGGMNFETANKDGSLNTINAFAWDMLFDAGYKWVGAGMYVSSPGTKFAGEDGKATALDKASITDLSFYTKFETKGKKGDASNLLEGLDAGVYFGFHKVLTYAKKASNSKAQFPLVMKVWGAYTRNLTDSMWIKPYVTLWGNTNHAYANKGPDFGLKYDIGVTYSPVEKVEFDVNWEHGALTSNELAKVVKASAIENQHRGKLVLSMKVSY